MLYCFLLALLLIGLATLIVYLAFRHYKKLAGEQIELDTGKVKISAKGFLAVAILAALALCGLAVYTLVRCQDTGSLEFQRARERVKVALDRATANAAEKYAPQEWSTLEAAVESLTQEEKRQNSRFPPLQQFDEATRLALVAEEKARLAENASINGLETARTQAEAVRATCHGTVAAVRTSLDELGSCRRRPKGFAADFEVMKGDLVSMEIELLGVGQAIARLDFEGALRAAQELQKRALARAADVLAAIEKLRC